MSLKLVLDYTKIFMSMMGGEIEPTKNESTFADFENRFLKSQKLILRKELMAFVTFVDMNKALCRKLQN